MGPILGKLCVGEVGYGLECNFKSLYRFLAVRTGLNFNCRGNKFLAVGRYHRVLGLDLPYTLARS